MYLLLDDSFYKNAGQAQLADNMEAYPEGIVIPIDKPYGWTSADVIRKIKFAAGRYFKNRKIKVGHAGTLDPLATGVLVVCIGKATKIAEKLQAGEKEYVAGIRFGATTPSFDLEKEIDFTYPYEHITEEMLAGALKKFIGEQQQTAPIFSAKLINGKRAYEYARSGKEAELKPSAITIYDLELIKFENYTATIRIRCSKGTYIRSFARDLGVALCSGAHLTSLVRTASGDFRIENCLKIEKINEIMKLY